MTYAATRWNLDDLVPSTGPDGLEKALAAYDKKARKVEAWRKRLKASITVRDFLSLLQDYEALYRAGSVVGSFIQLKFAADTQDQATLALLGRLQQLQAEISNRVLFVSLWWKALDDRRAEKLMTAAGDRRYWLEEMRHFRPHTLSEPEEKVINLKDANGASTLHTLREVITSGLSFTLEVEGEKKTLTEDALTAYVQHPDGRLREAAYRERFRVYSERRLELAQIYSGIVRDWRAENVGLRRFKSPLSVRNLLNDVPDRVVDTLLDVIQANAGVFQRYFRLKARWLGLEKLRRYDLYAPLGSSDKRYDYDTAAGMVLDTFHAFSPQVGTLARQVFDAGHVDAEIRPGKQGGAFCASTLPGMPPYVLMNYNGRARAVATLAHEMGHAIHALLASDHSALTFHSSLPLAETASVFSEMLLNERLLAQEDDPAVRREILAKALDDAYATVGRQGFFALWEKEAHQLIHQGKTADEMAARYLQNLQRQFGDSLELSDDFQWEWLVVPHFVHTPFYVYAYSFGQLLVLSLYQQYRREGESFKPRYLKILSYGGSEAPARILKEAGINIASARFWQGGYDVISGMIDELEKLQ